MPINPELWRVLDNAPTLEEDFDFIPTQDRELFVSLHDEPDNLKLLINPSESGQIVLPNELIVEEAEELKSLMHELLDDVTSGLPDTYIDDTVGHEAEHLAVAKLLGAGSVAFVLQVWNEHKLGVSGCMTISCRPSARFYDLETTKLGVGLITAHPRELSDDDLLDLHSLGYSVEYLAAKAISHNKSWRNLKKPKLPVPLSVDIC